MCLLLDSYVLLARNRLAFIRRCAEDSGKRVLGLREKRDLWWEEDTQFFDVRRSRGWVMMRRISHTSHQRGQLMAMLRMLGHDVHSNCAQKRFARWLGRLRPLDYAGVGRAVARWQPYAGLVYFHLLLDGLS